MEEKIEIDSSLNIWRVIKSVGPTFGKTINSKELSIALKNEAFDKSSVVVMHFESGKGYPVNIVYKCSSCENIHLGYFPPDYFEDGDDKKEFFKDEIVYIDRQGSFLTIEDLTFFLDSLKDEQEMSMETFSLEEDTSGGKSYTIPQVLKCPEKDCKTPHLVCYYEEDVA